MSIRKIVEFEVWRIQYTHHMSLFGEVFRTGGMIEAYIFENKAGYLVTEKGLCYITMITDLF